MSKNSTEECSVKICHNPVKAKGWCGGHYTRVQLTGELRPNEPLVSVRTPTQLKSITPINLSWLAGWLEGEGSFVPMNRRGYRALQIAANSTDIDVLERVYEITGVGNIRPVRRIETATRPANKPIWLWAVQKREDVVALMEILIPLMHSRRRARMEQILTWAEWWSHLDRHYSIKMEDPIAEMDLVR